MVEVTERKTKKDWALFIDKIASRYEAAEKIILVMDNLNTHNPGSLYEAFTSEKAKALWDRFEFVFTPNESQGKLAVHHRRCPDQTETSLSNTRDVTGHYQ